MNPTREDMFDFLETLRDSGVVNMFSATPYLQRAFLISREEAAAVLKDWMCSYMRRNPE